MITVTGPRIALAVFIAAGCFVLAMGAYGFARGGLSPHEGLAGTAGLVVAAVAWLWSRREKRHQDQDEGDGDVPVDRSECPYCDHGDGGTP